MRFYVELLGFPVQAEWEEPQGKGCVMEVGGGMIEFYEMTEHDPRLRREFRENVANDKIDIQLKTGELDAWAEWLNGKWEFTGPETLPWGQRGIQMRDPDGVLVAIYEDAE